MAELLNSGFQKDIIAQTTRCFWAQGLVAIILGTIVYLLGVV